MFFPEEFGHDSVSFLAVFVVQTMHPGGHGDPEQVPHVRGAQALQEEPAGGGDVHTELLQDVQRAECQQQVVQRQQGVDAIHRAEVSVGHAVVSIQRGSVFQMYLFVDDK